LEEIYYGEKYTRVEASKGYQRVNIRILCLFGVPFNTPGWPALSSVQKEPPFLLPPRFSIIPRIQSLLATANTSISAVEVCEFLTVALKNVDGIELDVTSFFLRTGLRKTFWVLFFSVRRELGF